MKIKSLECSLVSAAPHWSDLTSELCHKTLCGMNFNKNVNFSQIRPASRHGDMEIIRQTLDFFGFNYYFGIKVKPGDDIGWQALPQQCLRSRLAKSRTWRKCGSSRDLSSFSDSCHFWSEWPLTSQRPWLSSQTRQTKRQKFSSGW